MSHILLDTHYFLWLMVDLSPLTRWEHDIITDTNNELFLSVASWWEISIKNRQGKIAADYIIDNAQNLIDNTGIIELPITREDALYSGNLPWEHKDPFDRLIVAQAMKKNFTLLTRDKKIHHAFPHLMYKSG